MKEYEIIAEDKFDKSIDIIWIAGISEEDAIDRLKISTPGISGFYEFIGAQEEQKTPYLQRIKNFLRL